MLLTILAHARRHHAMGIVSLRPAAPRGAIQSIREERPIAGEKPSLPRDFVKLYTLANGFRIGDYEVPSLDEALWLTPSLLAFRGWGTGDYDSFLLRDNPVKEANVVFCGHDPPVCGLVAQSIDEWIISIYCEYCVFGGIQAPMPKASSLRTFDISRIRKSPVAAEWI